ncbi:NAD(P)-dependent dehydrogenase (short-subunit alcohol dehydrogenase family) [Thermosporothrix hazakensis]|jgi:NAD(P)-dependent dehydrogenase (short-subunit alcohol dehydrogenase family)|uniref:NAD(P)-dependent dehydrogenase (Short-subunit alcohol dehydrogenase family) n=2 Tax=Thermosporothrix TaxID=768650 RepID=A0A326TZ25_THEHA|nr:SDR family oxidoreductase [Thermosporothrix hazakensis]PZW22509.1 NAD(P)-dependent dehydrogenase (short-subunit alcohol dehydrogenase family) [Thermosporothrix hazakensis]BBH87762.1 short chain dehydrogenase [Thermosporothrix sp. COM3]GCE50198.1 short chain dehydrogenase [Thermosporothrix hazakensis]
MEITGQKVIVVGGSSGMGLAVVRAAQARGAHVMMVGRTEEKLKQALETLETPERVTPITADITREEDVRALFEAVGPFDHLVVTAAGDLSYQPIKEVDPDKARRIVDSKLIGALLLAKHGSTSINSKGSITLTAGIAAQRPLPTGLVVAAVNGALFSLTYGLAIALAPVRVNVLSPGWVDTPVWDVIAGANTPTMFAQMAQRLPVGRVGRPEDIAHAALFLMENEFTTGTILPVDGGHRLV